MRLSIPIFNCVDLNNPIFGYTTWKDPMCRWRIQEQGNELTFIYGGVYDVLFSLLFDEISHDILGINKFDFNINSDIIGLDIQRASWIYNEYVNDIYTYEDLYDFMEDVDKANRIFKSIKQYGITIGVFDTFDRYVRYVAFEDGWKIDPERYEKNIWLISAAIEVIPREELKKWFVTMDSQKKYKKAP